MGEGSQAKQVNVSDYMIGQTEVTQALWKAVMGTTPEDEYNSSTSGDAQLQVGDSLPMAYMSWNDAQVFVERLNALTGLYFRLPTEAEWVYAAKGGQHSRGYTFAGSDILEEVAWCATNAKGKIMPVGLLQPNELGIYDMCGNVWEFCNDVQSDGKIVAHGGSSSKSWSAIHYRPEYRYLLAKTYKANRLGLRLVLDKHAYVDLGLSVLWAATNVGAEEPEQYGDYYAWGETETKDDYTWENHIWCNGSDTSLTKYCTSATYGANGFTDGKTELYMEDDVAHVKWGGEWRMPSKIEAQELIDYCTWERITINGIIGRKVTGPNGNSIFLPEAGYYYYNTHYGGASYWPSTAYNRMAQTLRAGNKIAIIGGNRACGCPIRPVLPTDREPLPELKPAKRIGVFSVAKDKQVSFSQGNLQYIQSANLWRFADNQYDYIGEDNVKDGQLANHIDLFGWSTNSSKVSWGVSTSNDIKDYLGDFVDWGENIIHNDAANTWRTLSHDEWKYLFCTRQNAQSLFGLGCVAGMKGVIILPDRWELPEGMTFMPSVNKGFVWDNDSKYNSDSDGFLHNTYSAQQWALMEQAGAVFLPATGCRYAANTHDVGTDGNYWSSTCYDGNKSYLLDFYSTHLSSQDKYYILYGFSVRLVHDTARTYYYGLTDEEFLEAK